VSVTLFLLHCLSTDAGAHAAVVATLQTQHATAVSLAARVAAAEQELEKVRALYVQLWRARTGSVRDPFDGGEVGAGAAPGLGASVLGGSALGGSVLGVSMLGR
jgi:hypothetical protein